MKSRLLPLVAFLALAFVPARAQESTALPFPVSLGGQAATYKAGEPFAKIANAVKNDAAIEVGAKESGMIIINVHKVTGSGEPVQGSQPAVILLQGTTKGALDGTMDQQKLAPGNYLLSVVADGNTASILFEVE
ncbi:MAG: hypothetical protein IAE97_09400 [Chthoniobacterales bacterium]|nr:hypothetical protein [Chthoniobacterales bacterium]